MKSIKITIKGISPLLMRRYLLEGVKNLEKKSIEEQAELAVYRDKKTKELYIPGVCIQRALIAAAVYSKGKGRASLTKTAAACLLVTPEQCGLETKHYDIDSRPVVIPATKGRIVRHRPRLSEWQTTFFIEYDEDLLTIEQVRKVVDDAGSRVGLLEFRPACKGPFGRFMVIKWVENK